MPTQRSQQFRHRVKLGTMLTVGIFLLVMFQNFQPIPLKNLKPEFASARAVSETDGTADIRRLAPTRPDIQEEQIIALPQSGNDLGSISQDWLSRQSRLITGGADERLLADVNKRVNRVFKYEPLEEAFPSETDEDDEAPAAGTVRKPAAAEEGDDFFGMRPTSMKLVAINKVQLDLKNKTKLSCAFEGDNLRWNVSRPISSTFDVNLQHETAQSKSTVRLNYNW